VENAKVGGGLAAEPRLVSEDTELRSKRSDGFVEVTIELLTEVRIFLGVAHG